MGYYQPVDSLPHLFTLVGGSYQTFDLQGQTSTQFHFELFGINDSGSIAGPYQDNAGHVHGFVAELPGN